MEVEESDIESKYLFQLDVYICIYIYTYIHFLFYRVQNHNPTLCVQSSPQQPSSDSVYLYVDYTYVGSFPRVNLYITPYLDVYRFYLYPDSKILLNSSYYPFHPSTLHILVRTLCKVLRGIEVHISLLLFYEFIDFLDYLNVDSTYIINLIRITFSTRDGLFIRTYFILPEGYCHIDSYFTEALMYLGARNCLMFDITSVPNLHYFNTSHRLHYLLDATDTICDHDNVSIILLKYLTYKNPELINFVYKFNFGQFSYCINCSTYPCHPCFILSFCLQVSTIISSFCTCPLCKYLPKNPDSFCNTNFINFWKDMYCLNMFPPLKRFNIF